MKNKFINKIIPSVLILSLIIPFFVNIKYAKAQWATFDAGNMVQNTISAVSDVASEVLSYADNYKEMILDPIVSGLMKMIVQQITQSIVQWINSGFEGSPSFISNPGAFFLDIADQATGQFITGPFLKSLCSPFSIDIRIALAFKYRPRVLKRYECTLSTIIKNSKNAIKNASINGFTAGDFKQGGWPAFVTMTTEPQNNPYGAYLQADFDLSVQIANQQAKKKDEVNQGRGFLSWRDPKCLKATRAYNKEQALNKDYVDMAGGDANDSAFAMKNESDCPVQTPGSVIAGGLDKSLGSGTDALNLADEFGEIINALFAALVTKVIGATGLAGSSQKNSSGQSYLTQMNAEINNGGPETDRRRATLLDTIKPSKTKALEYKKYWDDALQIQLGIINSYDAAKACYTAKINAVPSTLTSAQINTANYRIGEINSAQSQMASTTNYLLSMSTNSDKNVQTLNKIEADANAAKTLQDLSVPINDYNDLIQSGALVNAINLVDAKTQYEKVLADSGNLKQDATRKMQACQIFPY